MEKKFKYSIGLYLIFSHLSIILSSVILKIIGYYNSSEFTTIISIITPMFAGYSTSIILFIINDRYNVKSKSNKKISFAFKLLSYLFPTLLSLSVLVPIWLQAYNLAFDNFDDFKSFLLIMESLFATYTGYFVYTLFEKKIPAGANGNHE